jgi:RsiW-degrading membrane proteinase PrsW (M82 family)
MRLFDPTVIRVGGCIVAGSLFWLQYWDLKDRRKPEPRSRLLFAFVLGAGSAGLALWLYRVVAALGFPTEPGRDPVQIATVCFLVVGPVEEFSKFLLARAFVFRLRHFDERVDGMIYAAAIALGFAAVENAIWLPQMAAGPGLIRAVTSPLVHTLFASVWGMGTAYALLQMRGIARFLWQVLVLAGAAFVHGAYDAVLYLGASSYVVAGVVLALWIGIIAAARQAALHDVAAEPGARSAG